MQPQAAEVEPSIHISCDIDGIAAIADRRPRFRAKYYPKVHRLTGAPIFMGVFAIGTYLALLLGSEEGASKTDLR